ncbi:MAG: hypothetical protein JHC73_17985 [Dolichospermum sp.]|nr:hypothetical protein [Dolichospermum sp.]
MKAFFTGHRNIDDIKDPINSNQIVLYPEYAPGVMPALDQWMVWLNILICVWLFMMDG